MEVTCSIKMIENYDEICDDYRRLRNTTGISNFVGNCRFTTILVILFNTPGSAEKFESVTARTGDNSLHSLRNAL